MNDHSQVVVVQIPTTGWVPAEIYYKSYGETKSQVDERVRKKHWRAGVHFNQPPGSKQRWINIEAVIRWAAGQDQKCAAYQAAN